MRLKRFIAEKVYGYLDFDIRFNRDLTFLTGINGSGKTTVVNAIVAMLTPSLRALADLDYALLRVEFENEGRVGHVEARRKDGSIAITASSSATDLLIYHQHTSDDDSPTLREARMLRDYYREVYSANSQNGILRYLSTLPTPMFLGLDRRADTGDVPDPSPVNRAFQRRGRNAFNVSLAQSVADAAALAESKVRDNLIAVGRIEERLRRELLLELLPHESTSPVGVLRTPTKGELAQIAATKRNLSHLPRILGIGRDELNKRLLPFLEQLEEYATNIPRNADLADILRDNQPTSKVFQSVIRWSFNTPQLKTIKTISDIVDSYSAKRQELSTTANQHLELVNRFLHDSGKQVEFDTSGYLSISVDHTEERKPIGWLSSGEAQIFIILTHLIFNPAAQAANVFIIDEPELSLHVQWQELFVSSVMTANPRIQYVMATHAPSIILERTEKCVEIGRFPGGETMIGYSPRAAKALALLKSAYNDYDFYVEDTGNQVMWLNILRPLLPRGKRLASVNMLGGRENVLKACRLDQGKTRRPKLYIIDGDFDHALGIRKPKLKHLYRIPCYCVENIILHEQAAVRIGAISQPLSTESDVAKQLNWDSWYSTLCANLKPLFCVYAVAHKLTPRLQTVSFGIAQLCEQMGNGAPTLSITKVRKRILAIARGICAEVGLPTFGALLKEVKARISKLEPRAFISGKNHLTHLLYWRTKRVFCFRGTLDTFKALLSEMWDAKLDPRLAARVRAL